MPQQVFDEVRRNRESKLKDALKSFEICNIKFPVFCKEYEEYNEFYKAYSELSEKFKIWKNKIDADVNSEKLPADKIINDFFRNTQVIECESVVEKAYTRYKKGNPPGKDNKYGDAINWECLLSIVPDNEDLYFISADRDYQSELSNGKMNPFLVKEWQGKKKSNIFFYGSLVSFLGEQVKDINLTTESEKQGLIIKLNNSQNFEETHGIIAMLNKYSGWTESQVEDICKAAEENLQVKWIIEDMDVYNFYYNLLSKLDYERIPDGATKRIYNLVIIHKGNELD